MALQLGQFGKPKDIRQDDRIDKLAEKIESLTGIDVEGLVTEAELSTAIGGVNDSIDTKLSDKANVGTSYTKAEADTKLNAKANTSTTYTKTQVDTALSGKADTTALTSGLAGKVDTGTVYTKSEVDSIVSGLESRIATLEAAGGA